MFRPREIIVQAQRFFRRISKQRKSLLTVEIDVYDDWTLDFMSFSSPGDFDKVRHAMSLAIKKLQQQMRDQKECPFHPENYPADVRNHSRPNPSDD